MSIDLFNSRLLDLIQNNYRGSAYFKVVEAFETLEKSGSLEQACSKLFRESFAPVQPPSPNALENFGKGNISQDYLTIQYIEDLLAKSFEIIKKNHSQDTYQYDNSLAGYELLKGHQFLIQGGFQDVENRYLIPRELLYRLELYNHFYRIFQTEVEGEVDQEKPAPYTLSNIDDVAFCGICGLLDVYLNNGGENFDFIPINLDFIPTPPTKNKEQTSRIPISQSVLKNILKNNRSEDIYSGPASKLRSFGYANEMANLKDEKLSVNISLSNLLASSSFLWDEQIFDISPDKIEAMTPEERTTFLAKNKAAVIDSCISHLSGFEVTQPLNKELKPQMIAISEQIKSALKEQKRLEKEQNIYEIIKAESRTLLEDAGSSMGENSLEVLNMIFQYLEKGSEIDLPEENTSEFNGLVIHHLRKYRQATIQSAYFSKQLEEVKTQIKDLKDSLENIFSSFTNTLSEDSLKDQMFMNRFLESYVVFSFIVLNREIFPNLPFKAYKKEQGVKKLLKIFEKKSQDKKMLKTRAFDALKNNAIDDIQELIDNHLDKIFSTFKSPSEQGRIKRLTQTEINTIVSVSQAIESGEVEIADKFHKLTHFLETLILGNEVFWGSIDQLSSRLSPDKIATLQAHMNACLMFLENGQQLSGIGLTQSQGFEKLITDLLQSWGEKGIKVKHLQKDKAFIESIQDFSIPVENLQPFDRAIQRAVEFSKKQLEDTKIELKPPMGDQQLQIVEQAILKLRTYLKAKMEGKDFQGPSNFLSKTSDKKTDPVQWEHINATLLQIPDLIYRNALDLRDEDLRVIRSTIGAVNRDEGLFVSLVKDFIVENNVSTRLLDYRGYWDRFKYKSGYEILNLAVICQLLTVRYREKKRLLEYNHPVEITHKYEGNAENGADVFIPNLLNLYEDKQRTSTNNQDLSLGLYRQFLPIFLSSFFEDLQEMDRGQTFFLKQKMELIKQLPEAQQTFSDIELLLKNKHGKLVALSDYLKESMENETMFDQTWIAQTYTRIRTSFDLRTRQFMQNVSEFVLAGVILSIAARRTPFGQVPGVASLIGLLGAYAWTSHIGPIAKDLFSFLMEGRKYLVPSRFKGKYTAMGVNNFILGLIKVALTAEIEMLHSPKWKDLRHELSFSLFLQEEFSMLKNLKSDLAVFPDRLNHLLPKSIQHTNISAMALNLFYMFNKEIFSIVPDDLLRGAESPLFMEALGEYIQAYQTAIFSRKHAYQGSEADKSLSYGTPSPLKRALIEEAEQGGLVLTFPRRSTVFKFLSEMRSNLSQGSVAFVLKPDQIVPIDEINLQGQIDHLREFLKNNEELLAKKEKYLEGLAFSLGKIKDSSKPLDAHLENVALQGVVSSYYMLRLCMSDAQNLYTNSENNENTWLQNTGSTPKRILTSPLFRDSLSILKKTTEFALVTRVPGAPESSRVLTAIDEAVQTFMATGELNFPSFVEIQHLVKSLQRMASFIGTNPQIGLPILLEYETNQNMLLPQVIYQQAIKSLGQEMEEESQLMIRGNFRSKVLYLSNSDSEIFFSNPETRGVGLSPFVIDALQEMIRNQQDERLMGYLGIAGDRKQQFLKSQQVIPRFSQEMQRFYPSYQQRLPIENQVPVQENAQGFRNPNPLEGSSYRPEAMNRPQLMENDPIKSSNSMQSIPGQNASQGNSLNLPRGQENVMQPSQRVSPQMNQGPNGEVVPNMQNPTQNIQRSPLGINPSPMILPMMMGQEENPSSLEQKNNPLEAEQPSQEIKNMVQVDSQGGSRSYSQGVDNFNQAPDENERRLLDEREQVRQEGNANLPPREPINFLGRGNAPEYQNPHNPEPEDLVQERIEPMNIGKGLAIGGGLILGASLLSNMMKKDEKKKKR